MLLHLPPVVKSDSARHSIQNGVSPGVNPGQAHYATQNSVRDQNHSSFALLGSTLPECEQSPAREHPPPCPGSMKRQGRGVLHSLGSWARLRGPGMGLGQALTRWGDTQPCCDELAPLCLSFPVPEKVSNAWHAGKALCETQLGNAQQVLWPAITQLGTAGKHPALVLFSKTTAVNNG